MTNEQMKAGRFVRYHKARKKIAFIADRLKAGHTIQLTTYTKATRYTVKHIDWFKATKSGAFVRSGNNWLCIDGAKVSAHP